MLKKILRMKIFLVACCQQHYLNSNLNKDAPPVMPIDVAEDFDNEDILGSVLSREKMIPPQLI